MFLSFTTRIESGIFSTLVFKKSNFCDEPCQNVLGNAFECSNDFAVCITHIRLSEECKDVNRWIV